MVDPTIYASAVLAQREHAALLAEANEKRTAEARTDIINRLDLVRRGFRNGALMRLGLSTPDQLNATEQTGTHALILAVEGDIYDSQVQLRALRDNATLAKTIRSLDLGSLIGGGVPDVDVDVNIPWFVWAVVAVVLVLALRPR